VILCVRFCWQLRLVISCSGSSSWQESVAVAVAVANEATREKVLPHIRVQQGSEGLKYERGFCEQPLQATIRQHQSARTAYPHPLPVVTQVAACPDSPGSPW
jgi:hypothetical protein